MGHSHSRIWTKNLSKTYGDDFVVKDVNLSLQDGEILALLGPNGAGKTTTIKMILGLITPTSGQACIGDFVMSNPSRARQAVRQVGAVLEGARNTYWRLSALENLYYFGGLRGLSRKHIKGRASVLFNLLGLSDIGDAEVRTFSRGMQQKVAIANALIHEPKVLILDEPTLGLDVMTARQIEDTLLTLAKEGTAILITTHIMRLAEKLADRVAIIDKGKIVAQNETSSLLARFTTKDIATIKVAGFIPDTIQTHIRSAFPDTTISPNDADTYLECIEQEPNYALSICQTLSDHNCTIISYQKREPDLEEVFLSLIDTTKQAYHYAS